MLNLKFLKRSCQHHFLPVLAAIFVVTTVLPSSIAQAASIAGKWKGGGEVKLSDGGKETVRCTVTYGREGGQEFSVSARCASGAGRVDQTGTLTRVSKNRYVGTVKNIQYSVTATVTVNVDGNSQRVSISSTRGTAKLQLAKK
jgi:hypothetical protein